MKNLQKKNIYITFNSSHMNIYYLCDFDFIIVLFIFSLLLLKYKNFQY